MEALEKFLSSLPEGKRREIDALDTPSKIQAMLDAIPYRTEDINCCPLSVFTGGKANCFDGALVAAACLHLLGYPPVIVEMIPWNDDDHILAIYKRNGGFGALAKSNFVGLRSREPVYRSLRELIMSYFDAFYNVEGDFTLRGYSTPLNLTTLHRYDWLCSDAGAEKVAESLSKLRQNSILTPVMISELKKIDELTYRTGLSVANPEGLYDPNKHSPAAQA